MGNSQATPVPEPPVYYREPPPRYVAEDILTRPNRDHRTPRTTTPSTRPACRYFARGTCHKGPSCIFRHDDAVAPTPSDKKMSLMRQSQKPCRHFQRGHCIKGDACLFSHENFNKRSSNATQKWSRELAGSWVEFGEGAMPTKIALPMDFSSIKISNIAKDSSVSYITEMLASVGMRVPQDAVHLTRVISANEWFATVTMEDPMFAEAACRKLSTCITVTAKDIKVVPRRVPNPRGASTHQIDCRQINVSWKRPTRSARVFFAQQAIAIGVHKRISTGKYKIQERCMQKATFRPETYPPLDNPWYVELPALSITAEQADITKDFGPGEQPCRIEFGTASYEYDIDLQSTLIRSMFEEFGALESWDLEDDPKCLRFTAKAIFVDESQAEGASSSLNRRSVPFLAGGTISAQPAVSVKFKVLCRVYDAVEKQIKPMVPKWRARGVHYIAYSPQESHRILRFRGQSRSSVAKAQKELQPIITGHVINLTEIASRPGGFVSWDVITPRVLKTLEGELGIVIVHDRPQSQLRVHGHAAPAVLLKVKEAVRKLIREPNEATHEIMLDQIGDMEWVLRGGLRILRSQIGSDKISLDRNSNKLIIVGGTEKDVSEAKILMARRQLRPMTDTTDCPICLCDPEEPVRTSCSHVYCAACFSGMCLNASKESKNITCEGNSGKCGKILSVEEISDAVDLETFEQILMASFTAFVSSHPKQFRYCPTPGCDRIYRVASDAARSPLTYSCSTCLTSICTACHVGHPGKSCIEHMGDTASDLDKLRRAKDLLGIKDCSRCAAPIEKNGGCNHMVCHVCKAHICWRCEATFHSSTACYAHMSELHGGNGL